MYTDEPSVSLKLKKGGKVHAKHHKDGGEHHGHKGMHEAAGGMMHGAHQAFESEHGKAPKKPSMAERRKAMNPQLYKKGGKVAHKAPGGVMPMGTPQAIPMQPMGQAAIAQMAPQARNARAMAVRKALTGMKKGGDVDHKMIEKLEKELHHHESMPASKAHHKASGGAIDRDETRTTIEKGAKKFERTKVVDGDHHDKHHGTGQIKEGRADGYAHGGKVHHISGHPEDSHEHHKAMAKHHAKCHKEGGSAHHKKMAEHHKKMCKGGSYATGGSIPSDTHESYNKGKTKFGGTIEDNEGDYINTQMHGAKKDKASGTGGVAMSNAGGFKHGGKMHHKAHGGAIEYDGDWENRPADTAKPGKRNTKTGEVKESNAGGYRHGGHASKKAYATGGNVVSTGKAEKMPKHFVSKPVANTMQSGTFAKGGKVGSPIKGTRKLASYGNDEHTAEVRYNPEYEEYQVHHYKNGKHLGEGPVSYHYGDKEDAHDTAKHTVERGGYKSGGKAVKKFESGGRNIPSDIKDQLQTDQNNRGYENFKKNQTSGSDNTDTLSDFAKDAVRKVKGLFTPEKECKKRGGRA